MNMDKPEVKQAEANSAATVKLVRSAQLGLVALAAAAFPAAPYIYRKQKALTAATIFMWIAAIAVFVWLYAGVGFLLHLALGGLAIASIGIPNAANSLDSYLQSAFLKPRSGRP